MDITGTYRGLAPDMNLVCWREVEMTIDEATIRFRAAGDDNEEESFSISLARETQVMTSPEVAELFDKGTDLSNVYGLFIGDRGDEIILLWGPIVPGWEGPRVFKRNLVEDEMSEMLRWGFFGPQVDSRQFEAAIGKLKTSIEEFTGEEVQIIRLPSAK